MSAPYLPQSAAFKKLNFVDLVAYNAATAIWGASTSNSALFAFDSQYSVKTKLMIAWLWAMTTISQGLSTTELKEEYVLWGFIESDGTTILGPFSNVSNLTAGIVISSVQGFFIYEIWKNSRKAHLIPIFAAPPVLLQLVIPLSSIASSSSSSLDFYRKDLLLATFFVQAVLGVCIFIGLSNILAPRYLIRAKKEMFPAGILWFILFSVNSGFWVVLVSISDVIMFYFLYSYSSLFLIYSHLTTTIHFITLLTFLTSDNILNDNGGPNSVTGLTSSAARARMIRNANAKSLVVNEQNGEEIYFKNPMSMNEDKSLDGHSDRSGV